jgi:hypothetical protein
VIGRVSSDFVLVLDEAGNGRASSNSFRDFVSDRAVTREIIYRPNFPSPDPGAIGTKKRGARLIPVSSGRGGGGRDSNTKLDNVCRKGPN